MFTKEELEGIGQLCGWARHCVDFLRKFGVPVPPATERDILNIQCKAQEALVALRAESSELAKEPL